MSYIENPKTKGSGMVAAIPQKGTCPVNCDDCFFQSGRSYLEPLEKNLPNMPDLETTKHNVIRVNDGNDSNNQRDVVIKAMEPWPMKFFNTSIPKDIDMFPGPVVLTLNPGNMTDKRIHKLVEIPKNLMFVRLRVNMWNVNLLEEAIAHYGTVPIVLTFMRYYNNAIPEEYKQFYVYKKKILNSYFMLNENGWKAWQNVINTYKNVFTCGKEGDNSSFLCSECGNCLREFFATRSRMKEII